MSTSHLLPPDTALYFRDTLRDARAELLRDAEAFSAIVHALERLGSVLCGRTGTLRTYEEKLLQLASLSPLAAPELEQRAFHVEAGALYSLLRTARNDAMHQGAAARHLGQTAIAFALIIEDALVCDDEPVGRFMVRHPVVAEPWQPLSLIRQIFLENSFSFLPYRPGASNGDSWLLVSDAEVARYLRSAGDPVERKRRLATTLSAAAAGPLRMAAARCVDHDTRVSELLGSVQTWPILVVGGHAELLGIATPFDLL